MRKRLHGVIALLVTPFHDDFSLNEEALRAEIDWCFGHGATGIVATPSIGEFIHLSDEERLRCFEITLERAAKHRNAITAAVTSGPDTRIAQRFTVLARKMGFVNAMVIPPFYRRRGSEEVCLRYQQF